MKCVIRNSLYSLLIKRFVKRKCFIFILIDFFIFIRKIFLLDSKITVTKTHNIGLSKYVYKKVLEFTTKVSLYDVPKTID